MNPKTYQKRRDELLALLNDSIALDVPEPHLSDLKQAHRKCQEDQFEIALVGEFQGGKSTTFNTLCDGREISPRGLRGGGVKTSAGIVTAQHLSDSNEEEHAKIKWRTSAGIVLGMADLIRCYLYESEVVKAALGANAIDATTPAHRIAEIIDPHNPVHAGWINAALNAQWERWAANKARYSNDELDQLRIATLQMRFVSSPESAALTAQSQLTIAEFQKLITFPLDWELRWEQGPSAKFEFAEVGFILIAEVLVRLHSKNLGRLGCRITDCPGLFVSAWDTKLARDAMMRADAIWYLVNGAKTLGEGDRNVLMFIRDHGWEHKLHISFNLRGKQHSQCMETIMPTTQAALNNMGLVNAKLHPYDAFLAFRAGQGDLIVNKSSNFADTDKKNLIYESYMDLATQPTVEAAWLDVVGEHWRNALRGTPVPATLDAETVARVREASRLDAILGAAESRVVHNKSRSIMVDNGAALASSALARYEADLELTVAQSRQRAEEHQKQAAEARKTLEEFLTDARYAVDQLKNRSDIDQKLSKALWEPSKEAITKKVAAKAWPKIDLEITAGRLWTGIKEKADFLDALNPVRIMQIVEEVFKERFTGPMGTIVSEEMTEAIQATTDKFMQDGSRDASHPVQTVYVAELLKVTAQLERKWQKATEKTPLLKGIRTADFSQTVDITAVEKVATTFDLDVVGHSYTALIRPLLKSTIPNLIELSTQLLPDFVRKLILSAYKDLIEANMGGSPVEKFERTLGKNFELQKGSLQEAMETPFAKLRLMDAAQLEEELNQIKSDFDARCKAADVNFAKSESERVRIAQDADEKRVKRVAPMRQRIEVFTKAVQADESVVA